jgi:hypothetical protein
MPSELFSEVQAGELTGYEQKRSQARQGAVLSAVQLFGDVKSGRVPWYLLQEALQPRTPAITALIARNYPGIINMRETMTRSDFPLLMGDMIERVMLARWGAFPQAWRQFVGVGTRRDFRTGRAIAVDGLEGAYPEQMEEEELQYGSLTETGYTYGIKKFSLGAKVSWELVLNDDLNAFDTIPDRLGRGAARTVARFVTDLYANPTGPDATFFSAGNGNLIPAGAPSALSITSLSTAYGMLRGKVDSSGEPIMVESAVLVVPPALEVTARNLMNSTVVVPVSTSGGPVYNNWITQGLSLAVDPYLPVITTTGTIGATEWFLFASPAVARPAIEVSFLSGYEQPVLYQKVANTARVGGGIDQTAGDFSTMSQEWKSLIAFGGSLLDPKSAVGSFGQ